MQSDTLLVQQTLTGDEQAFHRLIILYQSDIYALAMSWVKNPDDAKDLVQEIFFEAYRNLASLRQPERFHFWLRQIAKNRCHNWLERKKQDFDQLSDDMIAETPSVDDSLILRETLAKVMQAIDGLPEMEKQLLKERYLDDASYAELQARHGLSYKALNMRLIRAKQKVREQVTKMLAGIAIFSWQDVLKKTLSGGVEAVKISVKTKLIIAGIAIAIISGGTGLFVWRSHQSTTDLSDNSVSQISQNVSKQIPAKSIHAVNTKVTVTDKTPKQETDESKETELDNVKTDEPSNTATNIKTNELSTDERTPDQWGKYKLLDQLIPRRNELLDKQSKIQLESEAEEPSKFPPPKDIPLEQQIVWVNQKEREFEEKWGKIRKEIPAEIAKIEETLIANFPTAITRGPISEERVAEIRKDAKIPDGFLFPIKPGSVVFDINRKELRKIVGGSLPMDKGKYVKAGNDWVPAD